MRLDETASLRSLFLSPIFPVLILISPSGCFAAL